MRTFGTLMAAVILGAAGLASGAGVSQAGGLDGTWKVVDTAGAPFEIVLGADGSAKADRSGEGMTGTWKDEDGAAVIIWDTGWTTRIAKDGDGYKKTAFKKGEPTDGTPANMSAAEKVK